MAKRLEIKRHDTVEELRREIKYAKDGRYQNRLRCVLMAMEGKQVVEIRKELMISTSTYAEWIKRYNKEGKEGLKRYKSGRKEGRVIWDKKIFEALFEKLDKMEEYWSVPKMQAWIEKEFHVVIPLQTIRNHLRQAGYRYKSSRPNPYKGDVKKQKAFKKTVFS